MGTFVSRAPTGAVLHHRGRRTGRSYKTPVLAFRTPDGYVVPLAYSRDAAWALNLLAAGGGEMTRFGRRYQLNAGTTRRTRSSWTSTSQGVADDAPHCVSTIFCSSTRHRCRTRSGWDASTTAPPLKRSLANRCHHQRRQTWTYGQNFCA
jgi:deazaflavin-dependent oxidoreductase (nitroreductase family)